MLRTDEGKTIPCDSEIQGGELINSTLGATFTGPAACAGSPYFLNERLIAQQGLFLFSLNMEQTLEQNLYGMFGVDTADVHPESFVGWFTNPLGAGFLSKLQKTPVIKIVIPSEERARVLHDLKQVKGKGCQVSTVDKLI